jgi:hypothetical protein
VATFNAIAATTEALRRYLRDAPRPAFPQLSVDVFQPSDFQSSPPAGGRISIFLYRVAVNGARRNLGPIPGAPELGMDRNKRYRSPIPLDLYLLLSAWGLSADFQQRLLGWCIRTIEDAPVVPASVLNQFQPDVVFRETETVELLCEPLQLQDLNYIWELVKPNPPLSITYVARMIAIESTLTLPDAELVQTRGFDMGQRVGV